MTQQAEYHKDTKPAREEGYQAGGVVRQGQVDVLVKEAQEGLLILLDAHLGGGAAAHQEHLLLGSQPLHLLHHLLLDPVEGLCAAKLLGALLVRHKHLHHVSCVTDMTTLTSAHTHTTTLQ